MSERTPISPALRKFVHEADRGDLYLNLPFSNLKKWQSDTSIYVQALSIPALARLGQLRPLAFISYLGNKTHEDVHFLSGYNHTRINHSLTVALVGETIGKNNKLSQHEIMILRLGGFLHDNATGAFGDTIKQLDPENLNEENFWWETLGDIGQAFVRRFTKREILDKVIKNEGMLGEILDIADRITYTMQDLYAVQKTFGSNPLLNDVNKILSIYPDIGDVYKDVHIDKENNKVFFEDPKKLYAFLKIRALLHKDFYLNPVNQGRELLITKVIEPFYDRTNGPITLSLLRKMGDYSLLEMLNDAYPGLFSPQSNLDLELDIINWFPTFERFETEEEAKLKEQELNKQEGIAVIGIKKIRDFDSGTSYNVMDRKNTRIVPLSEYDPEAAAELEAIGKSTKGFFLIYADLSQESPMNPLIKKVIRKQQVF